MKNPLQARLMQLYRDNVRADAAAARPWQAGEDVSKVYLYGAIGGYFGIDALDFASQLNQITSPRIELHINSPGGDVFDGRAIASAIRQHPAEVTVHVDALCASAATYAATAADRVVMEPGSFFMIHNGWSITVGDKREHEKTMALLDQIDATCVADYAARSGATPEQIATWMDAETWFSAQAAVDNGFANEVGGSSEGDAQNLLREWNLRAFRNAPKVEMPAPPAPAPRHDLDMMALRLQLRTKLAR